MDANSLTSVKTVVFAVGELSGIVPEYLYKLYPAATNKTRLQGSGIRVEMIPGDGRCRNCGEIFNIPDNDGFCPYCDAHDFELISGSEFLIKELEAY